MLKTLSALPQTRNTTAFETQPADRLRTSRPESWASLQIRTHLEPAALAALLRNELPRVHPAFRMTGVTLQSILVDNTIVRERVLALLSGFFSIVAILLVACSAAALVPALRAVRVDPMTALRYE
ncbi:MAG: hypothetical protein ACRD7E_26945 [Bryobacteraceae bacterium]